MAAGTLYTFPNNYRAFKVLIAAQYSGSEVSIDENFKFTETNKEDSFLAKFPLGKVPAFESASGDYVFESNAIAHYVANDQLTGSTRVDKAHIQQWISFSENEILPAACIWVFPCLGLTQFNKQECDKAKGQLKIALQLLDKHLLRQTYLVGEAVTLADIIVMCNLLLPFEHVFDVEFRMPYTNVVRWFVTMINQPQVKAIIPDFHLCEKAAKFDPVKYAEIHGIQKKEKKAPQPKKEHPPKEEKPAKEESDEETEAEKEAKTAVDPFAVMPIGTFKMDEFKRTYCNNDILTVAIPYLWEHFDSENYSIWLSEYKYPAEVGMIFKACNLVSGMFQRLDKLNKNAFASVLIFGENNTDSISGVWIWRGHELVFNLTNNWNIDFESYSWAKLDPINEEHKQLVAKYLIGEGEINGKTVNQGKVFK